MKQTKRYIPMLIALAVLALVLSPAHAATVTVRVGTVQAPAGGTVEVPVEVAGAPGIGALQLELVYDPTVLTAQEVVKGPLLTNAMIESTVAPRGRTGMALVSPDPIKGDGIIAKVRFKVIGSQGQTSALTLEKVQAWERESGRDIIVTTEAGRATIAAESSALLLLVLAACLLLLLLLSGGGGLFLLSRRNRAPRVQYAPQPYGTVPPYGAPPPQAPGPSGVPPRPQDLPK